MTATTAGFVSLKAFGLGLGLGLSLLGPLRIWGLMEDSIVYGFLGFTVLILYGASNDENPCSPKMTYNQVQLLFLI